MNLTMSANEKDYKAKLVAAVKKEVKQLMEESVTRKFVHEESGSVTALCAAVEACLSQGLRRRALGLFKTSSTTALLHKIAKHCPEAELISIRVQDLESLDPNRRSSSSSDSVSKPSLRKNASLQSIANPLPKYLWIRLALFEKQLARIIDYLVANATKYYDRDALVADPDYGTILSSLLYGPCALDYTRTRLPACNDPAADELLQRQRISRPPSTPRCSATSRRPLSASADEPTHALAKEYVESMHQNSRAALLFGKNNVRVDIDQGGGMAGYLSLHQVAGGGLVIKWTPNGLMNGWGDQEGGEKDKSIYWDYAFQVKFDDIVYVHCHQESESGGTIILVGQDGVQRPPIHFPKGGHMLAFLSCVETGLLPKGRLDPPVWSERSGAHSNKYRRPLPALTETEETTKDYVFRIIDNTNHKDIIRRNELMDRHAPIFNKTRIQLASTSTSSESSSKSLSMEQAGAPDSPPSVCIQAVCESMKRQIISRAFYGWLAYCRHLSTVRTHLSGLVSNVIVSGEGVDDGITVEKWKELCQDGVVSDRAEVFRLTYFGGVDPDLRKEIWPYLLGHYKFSSTTQQRNELNEETKQAYENTMSEWLAVEAIVRQKDKENQANAIAKLSSESTCGEPVPNQIPGDLTNEVFADISDDDYESNDDSEPPQVQPEEKQKPKRTKQNTIKYESDEEGEVPDPAKPNPDPAKQNGESKPETKQPGTDQEVTAEDEPTATDNLDDALKDFVSNVIVTNASVDMTGTAGALEEARRNTLDAVSEECNSSLDTCIEAHGLASPARSACVSPASSNGGVYSQELLETFGLNLHRIEKDVQRCDRNYWYFAGENLDKLRNVMCTYVWEHLDVGYMQGMCDLVAPLLVTFNDESLTYACFCHLMQRMVENFPSGTTMDCHLANMRSLIQVLDAEMYELMSGQGDYTHFYFCYRWFLLDFKRELVYDDVFKVWECIWAAGEVASSSFVLFLAMALLETYREVILGNSMDFTDIIKFFNEMAERHNAQAVLKLARDLVLQLQLLIENK